MTATSWNRLCWFGSLWNQAADVLHTCEQAVTLAPDDGNIRDSLGVARALTGDYQGAIADWQCFLAWSQDRKIKATLTAKRQGWITAMQAGRNPFDAKTLEALRQE